jgi:hypothetical protein
VWLDGRASPFPQRAPPAALPAPPPSQRGLQFFLEQVFLEPNAKGADKERKDGAPPFAELKLPPAVENELIGHLHAVRRSVTHSTRPRT